MTFATGRSSSIADRRDGARCSDTRRRRWPSAREPFALIGMTSSGGLPTISRNRGTAFSSSSPDTAACAGASWRRFAGQTSTSRRTRCVSAARTRRRRRGARCHRSRTTRRGQSRFQPSCRRSSLDSEPTRNQSDSFFLLRPPRLSAIETSGAMSSMTLSTPWTSISPRTTCATRQHHWRSRRALRSLPWPACWATNPPQPRSTITPACFRAILMTSPSALTLRLDGPSPTSRHYGTPQNHRPSTDQRGAKSSRAIARKQSLTCANDECPRQDSNLRHRL
jgi:hypothetical protein